MRADLDYEIEINEGVSIFLIDEINGRVYYRLIFRIGVKFMC